MTYPPARIRVPRIASLLGFASALAVASMNVPPVAAQEAPASPPPAAKPAGEASADGAASKGFESLDAAIEARAAAVAARDLIALEAVFDPRCFEGLDEAALAYVEEVLKAEMAVPLNKLRPDIQEVPADAKLPFEGALSYPVRPNRAIQAIFDGPGGVETKYFWAAIVEEDGTCRMVFPVPTKATSAARIESRKVQAERDKRVRKLTDEIKEPLRSELLNLLKTSNLLVATRRYVEATGLDEGTAVQVVDRFMRQNGLANYQDPKTRPKPSPSPKPEAKPEDAEKPAAEPEAKPSEPQAEAKP